MAAIDCIARELHGQMVELLDAARSGELPVGPSYRHRVEGAITTLEAVLGLPPSLAPGCRSGIEA